MLMEGAAASSVAGSGSGSNDRDSALKYEQWRERMRDKYGLDTSRYTQPPPTSRPAPPPDSPRDSASARSVPPAPTTSRSTCVMV